MKKKVFFEIEAPNAKQVLLVGDFTDWKNHAKKMRRKRGSNDTFSASLSLPPGTYEYKYIVDGEWKEDPNAPGRANSFGTQNSVVSI